MKKVLFMSLLLVLAISLAGCLQYCAVSGVVTDSQTGSALSGAKVIIDGQTATTDSAGNYNLLIKKGTHSVTAQMTGYQTKSFSHSFSALKETLNIALDPALISISGRVYKQSSLLPDAMVHLFDESTNTILDTVYTDVNGQYSFANLPANQNYHIEVRGDHLTNDEIEFAQYQDNMRPTVADVVVPDIDVYYEWDRNLTVNTGTYSLLDHTISIADLTTLGLDVSWMNYTPSTGNIIEYTFEVQKNTFSVFFINGISPTTHAYNWNGVLDDGTTATPGNNYEWVIGYRMDNGWFGHMHQHVHLEIQ